MSDDEKRRAFFEELIGRRARIIAAHARKSEAAKRERERLGVPHPEAF